MERNIYYQKVLNQKNLELTIDFLKKGFNWSDIQAKVISEKIIYWNPKDTPYAFICRDKLSNKLIGAILIHYQGIKKHKKNIIKVLNLSWWYVEPEYRGLGSIDMAKKVCFELKDCIITNFSATKSAYSVFKFCGCKDIKTYTTNYYLPQYLFGNFKFGMFKNIKIIRTKKNIYNKDSFELIKKDSFEITLKIKKVNLNILLTKSIVERKIFKLRISIPRIHIIWTSNNNTFLDNYHLILGYLMFRYLTPMISTHCLSNNSNKVFKVWTKHIIFSSYSEINSVISLGSENSISL